MFTYFAKSISLTAKLTYRAYIFCIRNQLSIIKENKMGIKNKTKYTGFTILDISESYRQELLAQHNSSKVHLS